MPVAFEPEYDDFDDSDDDAQYEAEGEVEYDLEPETEYEPEPWEEPVAEQVRQAPADTSEFFASRTAEVANAITSAHPELVAILENSSMVPTSLSAPLRVSLPEPSMASASRSEDLVELIGVGWPPRRASTTNRWTVLLPTSSTPSRTHTT